VTTYVDASVVLRVLQVGIGSTSPWPAGELVSSSLLRVECLRTLDRARLKPGSDEIALAQDRAKVLELLGAFSFAPITDPVLQRAGDPFPTSLGSLDAIHLATALELRADIPDLLFATHDRELALAARAVGFEVSGV